MSTAATATFARRGEQHRIDVHRRDLPERQEDRERHHADAEILQRRAAAARGRDALGARLVVGEFALRVGGARRAATVLTRPPAACGSAAAARCAARPRLRAHLAEARIGAQRIAVARMAERHVEHLLDAAGPRAHHRDAVAEQDRLVDRVGDEHHGLALFRALHELQQFLLQDFAGLRVERGERLVHQQHRRVHRERADEADALLHAAGELIGIVLLEAGEADQLEIMRDALLDRRRPMRRPSPGRTRRCRRPSSTAAGRNAGTPWRRRRAGRRPACRAPGAGRC